MELGSECVMVQDVCNCIFISIPTFLFPYMKLQAQAIIWRIWSNKNNQRLVVMWEQKFWNQKGFILSNANLHSSEMFRWASYFKWFRWLRTRWISGRNRGLWDPERNVVLGHPLVFSYEYMFRIYFPCQVPDHLM